MQRAQQIVIDNTTQITALTEKWPSSVKLKIAEQRLAYNNQRKLEILLEAYSVYLDVKLE